MVAMRLVGGIPVISRVLKRVCGVTGSTAPARVDVKAMGADGRGVCIAWRVGGKTGHIGVNLCSGVHGKKIDDAADFRAKRSSLNIGKNKGKLGWLVCWLLLAGGGRNRLFFGETAIGE